MCDAKQGFCCQDDQIRNNNFKTALFVNYLGSMLTDFHKTSKTEIFWWDVQNEGPKPYANFKTACFVKYLGSMITDLHETFITGILCKDNWN